MASWTKDNVDAQVIWTDGTRTRAQVIWTDRSSGRAQVIWTDRSGARHQIDALAAAPQLSTLAKVAYAVAAVVGLVVGLLI